MAVGRWAFSAKQLSLTLLVFFYSLYVDPLPTPDCFAKHFSLVCYILLRRPVKLNNVCSTSVVPLSWNNGYGYGDNVYAAVYGRRCVSM
jgi:hypothetical protein